MANERKPTFGYPNVEKLIDSEDFNDVNRAFQGAYEQLSKQKKGLRAAKEAKKAMLALEKGAELLKELLRIKYRLQEEIAKAAKK